MARLKSGGLNKILNFIGLVDDEEPRDTYSDEYTEDRSRNYVPRRETRSARNDNAPAPRRRTSDYEPTRPVPTRRTESRDSQPRRTVGSYASSRSSSRYDQPRTPSRFDSSAEQQQPREETREKRRSTTYRTVMYNITKLDDCCDVIDSLLLNNTVLMNMEELDNVTMQRSIDTLSGAVFALHATIKKVSERTYLAAPMDMQVDEVFSDRS